MSITVFFDPNGKHGVSAVGSDITVLAEWFDYDETDPHGLLGDGDCVVTLQRDAYLSHLTGWLDDMANGRGRRSIQLENLQQLPEGDTVSANVLRRGAIDPVEFAALRDQDVLVPAFTGYEVKTERGLT